jgi:hypothetical protein
MALKINIPDIPNSTQRISLEGVTYLLRLVFNTRSTSWHFNLSDELGDIIYDQTAIQHSQNLSFRFRNEKTPLGDFFCLKIEDTEEALGRDNFGNDKAYRLYYITPSEIIELGLER